MTKMKMKCFELAIFKIQKFFAHHNHLEKKKSLFPFTDLDQSINHNTIYEKDRSER